VVDVTPLRRVPGYRWLFAGLFFVQAGRQLTVVAVPWQVFELTGSTLTVGLVGVAQLVPILLVSLVGGALADAVDRRKLLFFSQLVLAGTAGALLWNSLSDTPAIWPLFVFSAINAGVSAIDAPARHAIVPGLVGLPLLPSAMALNQTLTNVAKAAFPAIGGLMIANVGLPFSYASEIVLFVIGATLINRIPNVPIEGGGRKLEISSVVEGFRFLKGRRVIQAALLIDLNAMVFGMPTALFPAMGTVAFGGDASTVGLLYAAPGIGALIGALTSGWVIEVRRPGRATVLAVIGWGLAIAIFGLTSSLPLAMLMLAFAGLSDVVSAIFRGTIIQYSTPDSLRGRLAAIHMSVVSSGPRLGDLEAGAVAEVTSVRFSVVSGGLACVIGALVIARWAPQFLKYRYTPDMPGAGGPGLPATTGP
jgi:MFS family permease